MGHAKRIRKARMKRRQFVRKLRAAGLKGPTELETIVVGFFHSVFRRHIEAELAGDRLRPADFEFAAVDALRYAEAKRQAEEAIDRLRRATEARARGEA